MFLLEEFCKPIIPSEWWLEYLKDNFHYNPDTGLLYRNGRKAPIGSKNDRGYLVTRLGPFKDRNEKRNFKTHHIIFYLHWGLWPPDELDHEDKNRENNRIENLEIVSRKENLTRRFSRGKVTEIGDDPF